MISFNKAQPEEEITIVIEEPELEEKEITVEIEKLDINVTVTDNTGDSDISFTVTDNTPDN